MFNRTCIGVAYVILTMKRKKDRARAITKFIKIAEVPSGLRVS
jgi:hypothetical protein